MIEGILYLYYQCLPPNFQKMNVYGRQKMEKASEKDQEIFMLSPGSQYFTMPSKLLRRTTTNVNVRIGSTLLVKEKGVYIGRKLISKIIIRSVNLYLV